MTQPIFCDGTYQPSKPRLNVLSLCSYHGADNSRRAYKMSKGVKTAEATLCFN